MRIVSVAFLSIPAVCFGHSFFSTAKDVLSKDEDRDSTIEFGTHTHFIDSEKIEQATLALKNALNNPTKIIKNHMNRNDGNPENVSNHYFEDIGSSLGGGRLVRFRKGIDEVKEQESDNSERASLEASSSTRQLRGKTIKDPKRVKVSKSKAPNKKKSKKVPKDDSKKTTKSTKGSAPPEVTKAPVHQTPATQAPTQAPKVTQPPTQAPKVTQPPTQTPEVTQIPNVTESPSTSTTNKGVIHRCTMLVAEEENWTTWFNDLSNFTPIFRPATDAELRGIVENSKKHGCSVRMMGARHSSDGLVTQRKEEDTVVISLASHVTNIDGWHDSINPESSTFRIGAGKSWLDVSAMIRPHGFVLNSRTSGTYFSVGGVVANMVHGGGRAAGFMHDDVVKMLVLTSDGNFQEVEGDDLSYWRSSAGLLGMIIAVEMKMHSEAIPQVLGIDPSSGAPILDLEKGGLVMKRRKTSFTTPTNQFDFFKLVQDLTSKVYETHAMQDSAQFFFNFYTNSLLEYYTDFSGPRFSGATGPFPDETKAANYESATKTLVEKFPDVAFTGGTKDDWSVELFCDIFCVPPSGPAGDGSPCIQIPSSLEEGKLLCEVPLETAAAISTFGEDGLNEWWDAGSSASNDGYFLFETSPQFETSIAFVPARSFPNAFGTYYDVTSKALAGTLFEGTYEPNSMLEFRFINPEETAVLNPLPSMAEVKAAFNEKHQMYFGPQAFDLLFEPLPAGMSDGWVAIEIVTLKNIYDDNFSKYAAVLQKGFASMPSNPFLPYGESVVGTCDASTGILPCQGMPAEGTKCCNPPIPTVLAHFGKGWGYSFNPSTTPTTGQMTPYKDQEIIANMYSTVPSKQSSISLFNAKRAELAADVFAGGAMMRWLDPSMPNTDFEVRKLDGQVCGSRVFMLDPNKECINDNCIDSVCV